MMLTVGIPMNWTTTMRDWIKRECQKLFGTTDDLTACIPNQLKREVALQENILSTVSQIGTICDATPQGDDLVCLIKRHLHLNPGTS